MNIYFNLLADMTKDIFSKIENIISRYSVIFNLATATNGWLPIIILGSHLTFFHEFC